MGKFIIDKGSDDHYYFKLISSKGEIILTSEKYLFKAACKNGISTARANATNYLRYELETTYDGKYYFKLSGTNGQIIGKSCTYESSAKRNNFIELVKSATPYANVIDQTHSSEFQAI
jgi:uncharacterized protein YegP (UPF0339 family)